MNEIDVSKYKNCPYWHYGYCENNIINVLNSECLVHQNCFIKKTLEQLQQYQQCLDEIFEIIDTYGNNGIELSVERQECILQKIKEVKDNG